MSLASQVAALATRVGAEIKGVRGEATVRDSQAGSSINSFSGKTLYTYGNSWMDTAYFITLVRSKLGFTTLTNLATGGYRMQDTAMTALSPGAKNWTVGTGADQVVLVHDLGNNSGDPDTTANRGAALESARVLATVLSSATKTEQTAFTYSTSPAWSPSTVFDYVGVSGGTYAVTTNDGCWADFTVPAGESTLIVMGGDGVNYTTGIATVTQGARTVATKDTNLAAYKTAYRCDLGLAPVAIKLTAMTAGTARVTFSHAGRTGGTVLSAIDCLLTPMTNPPVQMWVKPNSVKDPTYTNKAALVTYLRSIPDTIASEFGPAQVIDTLPGWNPDTMLGPDLLHPNPAGSAYMANSLTSAMNELMILLDMDTRLAARGLTTSGRVTAPSMRLTTGAANGRIIKSDSSGVMSWAAPPTLYDTRANYIAAGSGIFAAGVLLFESDTTLFKIADGVNTWPNLPYANTDRYNSEVILNANALASGYNDNIGGVLVDDAIILTGMSFRIADPTELVTGTSGQSLTIQWYAGSPTALETTLLATTTLAVGQHDTTAVLATPQPLTINTVLRAKITMGSTAVAGSCQVQWRGRYAPK